MTWLQRYRLSSYVRRSFWILPVLGMILALLAVRLLHRIESAMGWQLQYDPASAMMLLGTMAASMFTLIVFVCSALLITLQLASAQLSPRVMSLVLHNRVTIFSLTLFVFVFTFTLGALVRIKGGVPPFTAYVAVYGSLVSLGVFLHLIDSVWRALRPSGVLALTARLGREVIEKVSVRWSRTDPAARPGLCLPDHGGHCLQVPFTGDQRPDHCGARHRPDSVPAPRHWKPPPG
jgi:uncharacterized membrane protein